ncbi:UNVERIFIED_CONTAM: Serine/threonine-protein phosphatase 7 long form [Sesamum indicum]
MDRRSVYDPRDNTVLSQQAQHRSDDIADGDLDAVLISRRADGTFWSYFNQNNMSERVQEILHQIGFYGVYRCGHLQLNQHFNTALVERWRSETHTFHFRVGEATITLQDVQIIWALPIDGEPVTGIDFDRTTQQWQEYCLTYIGFSPDANVLKGSRLQTSAITSHLAAVQITYNTPQAVVVQYARAVALLLFGGLMCPDSSGNYVSLLYLSKLEDIETARNYSWGSAVLAFLYRELCNASTKGKAAIDWSRITPLCPGLGAQRLFMGQVQMDNNRWLPAAPYGAAWNCQHTFTTTVRGTIRVIREILDEMQANQFIWQPYDMDSDVIMAYADELNPQLWRSSVPLIFYAIVEMHRPERVVRQFGMRQNEWYYNITRNFVSSSTDRRVESGYQPGEAPMLQVVANEVNGLETLCRSRPPNIEGYSQLVDRFEHGLHIIKEAITQQPQQIASPSDDAPTTSHRQRRSSSRMSTGSVERRDIGVDIAGPSTVYPPQDYYMPQPSQGDWFQSTPYMSNQTQDFSLDLGLDFNQPYTQGYNISPIPFPSFGAYRDNVESSSETSSRFVGEENEAQNEPVQNVGEEIRRPRRQRHRQHCGTGGHF